MGDTRIVLCGLRRASVPAEYGGRGVGGLHTFILPGPDWASLLDIVVKDAEPGDVIEVHMPEMEELARNALQRVNRDDVTVVLTPPRRRHPPGGTPEGS